MSYYCDYGGVCRCRIHRMKVENCSLIYRGNKLVPIGLRLEFATTTRLAIQRDSVLRGLQFNGTACYEVYVTALSNFEQSLIQLLNLYGKLYDNQAIDLETFVDFRILRLNTE